MIQINVGLLNFQYVTSLIVQNIVYYHQFLTPIIHTISEIHSALP